MNPRTTIIGAVILAGLSYFTFKVYQPQQQHKQEQTKLLHGKTGEALDTLSINWKDANFTLKKSGTESKWKFTDMDYADVDSSVVQQLLISLEETKLGEGIATDEREPDLSSYGLKEPDLTLSYEGSGEKGALKFGSQSEYTSERYVQDVNSGSLYTVSTSLYFNAHKTRDDFRQRTPLAYVDSEISEINLKGNAAAGETQELQLKNSADQGWRLSNPKVRASEDAVNKFTRALRDLKVEKFFDGAGLSSAPVSMDDLKNKPDFSAQVSFKETANSKPLSLRIIQKFEDPPPSKNPEENPAKREVLYALINDGPSLLLLDSKSSLASFNLGVKDLRETQYFRFEPSDVQSLKFEGSDNKEVSLTRKDGDWQVNGKTADNAFVDQLLKDLKDLTASDFLNESLDPGFAKPKLKVTLSTKDKTRTLVVGSAHEKDGKVTGYYAATDDLSEPFVINEESFKKINTREEVLMKAEEPKPSASASASASL